MTDQPRRTVDIETPSPLTPHSKALYEAGKTLLVDSIEVGREFCKFMIGVCSGAIPIYLGLLEFLLPDSYTPSLLQGLVFAVPPVLFLAGSVVFAVGYFPQSGSLSLDLPGEIERERTSAIRRRQRIAFAGFAVFVLASLGSVLVAIWALTAQPPSRPTAQSNTRLHPAGGFVAKEIDHLCAGMYQCTFGYPAPSRQVARG